VGIGDTAGDQARAAARAAAGDAAAVAVRRSRHTVRGGGAQAHAHAVLAPTLEQLAASALELLDRMLPTETLALEDELVGGAAVPALT
jgi:hypothetical protein